MSSFSNGIEIEGRWTTQILNLHEEKEDDDPVWTAKLRIEELNVEGNARVLVRLLKQILSALGASDGQEATPREPPWLVDALVVTEPPQDPDSHGPVTVADIANLAPSLEGAMRALDAAETLQRVELHGITLDELEWHRVLNSLRGHGPLKLTIATTDVGCAWIGDFLCRQSPQRWPREQMSRTRAVGQPEGWCLAVCARADTRESTGALIDRMEQHFVNFCRRLRQRQHEPNFSSAVTTVFHLVEDITRDSDTFTTRGAGCVDDVQYIDSLLCEELDRAGCLQDFVDNLVEEYGL